MNYITFAKYTNADNTNLMFVADDLTTTFCEVSDPQMKSLIDAFLDKGGVIEPFVAPEPPAPPTPAEKLAASGMTVDELKELLGL